MRHFRKFLVAMTIASLGLAGAVTSAAAETLLRIVAVDGKVSELTRADLLALPRTSFQTSTLWTDGVREFSGVPLKALLARLGVNEGSIRVAALNDYSVSIPVADLDDEAPIIADTINGAPFGVREKGPLWIVYPYDARPDYRTEEVYGRSVWQLVQVSAAD